MDDFQWYCLQNNVMFPPQGEEHKECFPFLTPKLKQTFLEPVWLFGWGFFTGPGSS